MVCSSDMEKFRLKLRADGYPENRFSYASLHTETRNGRLVNLDAVTCADGTRHHAVLDTYRVPDDIVDEVVIGDTGAPIHIGRDGAHVYDGRGAYAGFGDLAGQVDVESQCGADGHRMHRGADAAQ